MTDDTAAYLPFREAFASLDPDHYPGWHIDRQIERGFWRCWGSRNAAIIAEIRTYPSGVRELHGVAAAGDLAEIVSLIPLAETWGRENGCVRAVIESRPGWVKALPDYELHQIAVRKDL